MRPHVRGRDERTDSRKNSSQRRNVLTHPKAPSGRARRSAELRSHALRRVGRLPNKLSMRPALRRR
jgi:hypothetical protein